jgi:hypothetical protein
MDSFMECDALAAKMAKLSIKIATQIANFPPAPASAPPPSLKWPQFVKEHYLTTKASLGPNATYAETIKIVSAKYKAAKNPTPQKPKRPREDEPTQDPAKHAKVS